jgi:hypothetical protein
MLFDCRLNFVVDRLEIVIDDAKHHFRNTWQNLKQGTQNHWISTYKMVARLKPLHGFIVNRFDITHPNYFC